MLVLQCVPPSVIVTPVRPTNNTNQTHTANEFLRLIWMLNLIRVWSSIDCSSCWCWWQTSVVYQDTTWLPPAPALFSAVSTLHCLGLLMFPPLPGPGLGRSTATLRPGLETGFWITARLITIGAALWCSLNQRLATSSYGASDPKLIRWIQNRVGTTTVFSIQWGRWKIAQ